MTSKPERTVDVAVVGAGPAGCAAGVFCARADLDTVVFTNGRSTLQKCAFVENYLGFPAGIEPRALLELSREHLREASCGLREQTVEQIEQREEGFELATADQAVRADHVIAATWSNSGYLDDLDVETELERECSDIDIVRTDGDGETTVDGLYAAGRMTGTHHQALVNAGDGARVALNLIKRVIPEFYNDWVALDGYYAHYDREVPVGVEEITHEERRQRVADGHERMREFFSDG